MSAANAKQIIEASLRDEKGDVFRKTHPKAVPGVVYGKSLEPISIAMDNLSIEKVYSQLGNSTIFELKLPGHESSIPVLLHEVARHPNSNMLVHFDLYAVTLDQKIKTEISIHFEGEAPAQADSSLAVSFVTDTIEIEALPNDLPEQVVVDISDLEKLGDAKHVKDIQFDSGVLVLTDPDTALVKVDQAREEEEEAEPEVQADESDETNTEDGSSDSTETEASSESDKSA